MYRRHTKWYIPQHASIFINTPFSLQNEICNENLKVEEDKKKRIKIKELNTFMLTRGTLERGFI